jgi:hypothetical protein
MAGAEEPASGSIATSRRRSRRLGCGRRHELVCADVTASPAGEPRLADRWRVADMPERPRRWLGSRRAEPWSASSPVVGDGARLGSVFVWSPGRASPQVFPLSTLSPSEVRLPRHLEGVQARMLLRRFPETFDWMCSRAAVVSDVPGHRAVGEGCGRAVHEDTPAGSPARFQSETSVVVDGTTGPAEAAQRLPVRCRGGEEELTLTKNKPLRYSHCRVSTSRLAFGEQSFLAWTEAVLTLQGGGTSWRLRSLHAASFRASSTDRR